uniref:Uncharacterized protein n=1 Tax=Oryza brachyantha TaxID=4533 RepID=J3N2V3_ORYBR
MERLCLVWARQMGEGDALPCVHLLGVKHPALQACCCSHLMRACKRMHICTQHTIVAYLQSRFHVPLDIPRRGVCVKRICVCTKGQSCLTSQHPFTQYQGLQFR